MTNQREPVKPGDMAQIVGCSDRSDFLGMIVTVGETFEPHNRDYPKWAPFYLIPELKTPEVMGVVFSHEDLMKITPDVDIESELREVEVEA